MTKPILLLACLLALFPAFAQSPPTPGAPAAPKPPPPGENLTTLLHRVIDPATGVERPVLTRFTLDFPGGTPKQLVTAIEKAMGNPLNAIIPPEHADVKLPPLKMSNVDVSQLFQALELTSQKTEAYVTSTYYGGGGGQRPTSSYQQMRTSYGFRTQNQLSDESIWYFYVEKPTLPTMQPVSPQKVCRYFSLAPYLERGQTVDDITTAIQTGWKMLGEDDTPKISFHKETQLLIAVGEPGKLETIDAVLQALTPARTSVLPPRPALLPQSPPTTTPIPQRALKTAPVEPSAPSKP